MRWTEAQIAILRQFSNLGAEAVAEIIRKRTGVERTAGSVQRKASRLGVSMAVVVTCPSCGRKVNRLDAATGLCRICKVKQQRDRQREFNELLRKEAGIADELEYRDAARSYARERKATSRLCRKNGLPNKRQRGCGDNV